MTFLQELTSFLAEHGIGFRAEGLRITAETASKGAFSGGGGRQHRGADGLGSGGSIVTTDNTANKVNGPSSTGGTGLLRGTDSSEAAQPALTIELVPLGQSAVRDASDRDTLYLYEDRWRAQQKLVCDRILARLGEYAAISARECTARRIDAPTAGAFLAEHHALGSASCRYRYGLFNLGDLVAVATFSSPRNILRAITLEDGTTGQKRVRSYEWIRYAGHSKFRILGGMGKLLSCFYDDVRPEEVMSYADLEWSSGDVYRKLGFREIGTRPPVTFAVDPATFERKRDNFAEGDIITVGMGSAKYIL